jgi:TPR repeat protein
MAAEKGNAQAQFNIGNCYYFGMGIAKNKKEALKWWQKAAEQGNETARENIIAMSFEDDVY